MSNEKRVYSLLKSEKISVGRKEAIVLRLSKSYFTCFDNVSFISKAISDLLCSAVTGASDTTRRLYTDTEERIMKLHSIIGITSINGGCKVF